MEGGDITDADGRLKRVEAGSGWALGERQPVAPGEHDQRAAHVTSRFDDDERCGLLVRAAAPARRVRRPLASDTPRLGVALVPVSTALRWVVAEERRLARFRTECRIGCRLDRNRSDCLARGSNRSASREGATVAVAMMSSVSPTMAFDRQVRPGRGDFRRAGSALAAVVLLAVLVAGTGVQLPAHDAVSSGAVARRPRRRRLPKVRTRRAPTRRR